MQTRRFGKTGRDVSIVGFGGLVAADETPEAAVRYVRTAVERGVTYFDVAPTYGNAEERLGPALEPYRDRVFLACKTIKRTRDEAAAELRASLERLRTDYLDLYQFHAISTMDEVDAIAGPGGALEAFRDARDRGLIRAIGFSAHAEEPALALLDRFDLDTVMFPVNYVTWYQGHFGRRLLNEAVTRGLGISALKTLARTSWGESEKRTWPKCWYKPVLDPAEAIMAARWTFSRPVAAGVSPSHAELLWWMCDAADDFKPMTPEEEKEVERESQGIEPIFRT